MINGQSQTLLILAYLKLFGSLSGATGFSLCVRVRLFCFNLRREPKQMAYVITLFLNSYRI